MPKSAKPRRGLDTNTRRISSNGQSVINMYADDVYYARRKPVPGAKSRKANPFAEAIAKSDIATDKALGVHRDRMASDMAEGMSIQQTMRKFPPRTGRRSGKRYI